MTDELQAKITYLQEAAVCALDDPPMIETDELVRQLAELAKDPDVIKYGPDFVSFVNDHLVGHYVGDDTFDDITFHLDLLTIELTYYVHLTVHDVD